VQKCANALLYFALTQEVMNANKAKALQTRQKSQKSFTGKFKSRWSLSNVYYESNASILYRNPHFFAKHYWNIQYKIYELLYFLWNFHHVLLYLFWNISICWTANSFSEKNWVFQVVDQYCGNRRGIFGKHREWN